MSNNDDASSISTNPLEMALAARKMRARAEEWRRARPVDPWLQAIVDETNERYMLQRKLKRAGIGEVDPHYGRAKRHGAWYSKRIEQKQARRNKMWALSFACMLNAFLSPSTDQPHTGTKSTTG